jgi:hypothetical protein
MLYAVAAGNRARGEQNARFDLGLMDAGRVLRWLGCNLSLGRRGGLCGRRKRPRARGSRNDDEAEDGTTC